MTHIVTLKTGLSGVVLPNGLRYDGGAVVSLSDGEYSLIGATGKSALFSSDVTVTGVAAVSPSGDPTGAGDAAAISAAVSQLPAAGGIVVMAAGQWYLAPGAVSIAKQAAVYLQGAGRGATIISTVAGTAGDVIRMLNPTSNVGGGNSGVFGGGVLGVTIDGTNATAGSTGLHIGDMEGAQLDVCVQNFSGAGDTGVHIDNTIWWTEKLSGQIYSANNTSGVVFDMSGTGSSVQASHAYDDLLIWTECETGQNGIAAKGGATIYNGSLKVRGNYNTGSAASSCLTITGSAANGPDAGFYSQIRNCHLDIQVESNGNSPYPTTITLGSISAGSQNALLGCTGIMNFFNSWSGSNAYGSSPFGTGAITFDGWVAGDANLAPAGPGRSIATAVLWGTGFVNVGATTEIPTQIGDMFAFTVTADTTISLPGYQSSASSGPQRKTIFITQGSGGSHTVTWPKPGSPSLSSPAVYWPGGTAPTMTAAAGAIDKYVLETMDGIRWYGNAYQALS